MDTGRSPCEGGDFCEDEAYTLFISGGCDEGVQGIDAGGSPCSSSPCEGGGSCEEHDGTFTCYCTHHR